MQKKPFKVVQHEKDKLKQTLHNITINGVEEENTTVLDLINENKKKDKKIEQLKNTIHEIEEYTHERIKLYKKRLKFPLYHPMRTLHNIWLYERYLSKLKKLKGGKNDKGF